MSPKWLAFVGLLAAVWLARSRRKGFRVSGVSWDEASPTDVQRDLEYHLIWDPAWDALMPRPIRPDVQSGPPPALELAANIFRREDGKTQHRRFRTGDRP